MNASTSSVWTGTDRRQFLKHTALAAASLAAGCSALPSSPEPALVGTQLYGWGQYYDREKRPLGAHMGEALSAIRDCGYDYAEGSLDRSRPENNARFADQLAEKGLRRVSLYTGGRFHEARGADQTVAETVAAARVCSELGYRVLVCNPDPIGRAKTAEELATQVAALRVLGSELRKLGLQLAIHHHTPEMLDGAREFHHNFRNSAAGTVDFCYDVHWVYRGGMKPAVCLQEYGGRIVSWHLRQSREQIWWEDLAPGDIDYGAIARYAREHHTPARYTVELALEQGTKITRSVVENHRRSREYVKQVFGA